METALICVDLKSDGCDEVFPPLVWIVVRPLERVLSFGY